MAVEYAGFDPSHYGADFEQDYKVVMHLADDKRVRFAQIALKPSLLKEMFGEEVARGVFDSIRANRGELQLAASYDETISIAYIKSVRPLTKVYKFGQQLVTQDLARWMQNEDEAQTEKRKLLVIASCIRVLSVVEFGFLKIKTSESTIRRNLNYHDGHPFLLVIFLGSYPSSPFRIGIHVVAFHRCDRVRVHEPFSRFAPIFCR